MCTEYRNQVTHALLIWLQNYLYLRVMNYTKINMYNFYCYIINQ